MKRTRTIDNNRKLYDASDAITRAGSADVREKVRAFYELAREEKLRAYEEGRADGLAKGRQNKILEGEEAAAIVRPKELEETLQATHEGFIIICQRCGSWDAGVDNSVGFSEVSGAWGDISLICSHCGQETIVWEP